jgi:hypothetical protein
MQIRPNMLGIWPEGKGVQVEISSLAVQPLERMRDSEVHPNSNVIWTNIECSMIKQNGLFGSS